MIGVALLVTVVGAVHAYGLRVNEVTIPLEGLERDVTVMHISDVHIGPQRGGANLDRIVEETNRRQPDFVLINGDLVDGNRALEPGQLDALGRIEAPAYFTTGNHDHSVDMDRALEIIAGHGVRILHNEVVTLHGLQLVGLTYMNADEETFDAHSVNKLTIKDELPKIEVDDELPVLVMHHSPVGLEYVSAAGVDLMVSGHTHAGQVFPATIIAAWQFPLRKGLHERDGTQFWVSQGAGTYGPRMRLGTSNEIDLIRLEPAK